MGDYSKNRTPISFVQKTDSPTIVQKETVIQSSQIVDVKQLAEELSKYMKGKDGEFKNKGDSFDESKTLDSIANSMLVDRNDKESNMGDMSRNIVEIKNDDKETNNTIDILSGLDD